MEARCAKIVLGRGETCKNISMSYVRLYQLQREKAKFLATQQPLRSMAPNSSTGHQSGSHFFAAAII